LGEGVLVWVLAVSSGGAEVSVLGEDVAADGVASPLPVSAAVFVSPPHAVTSSRLAPMAVLMASLNGVSVRVMVSPV
jgi:hypothetical protein